MMEDSGIDSGDRHKLSIVESDNSSNESAEVIFRVFPPKQTAVCEKPKALSPDSAYLSLPPNTCKILQRKLELKVERAKKNYNQLKESHSCESLAKPASSLIPIDRLQFPGCIENQPLVKYNSNENSEDEEVSFFVQKHKSQRKQDLSDTFSIQEMIIESDSGESDSQNLEFIPIVHGDKFLQKFINMICCRIAKK